MIKIIKNSIGAKLSIFSVLASLIFASIISGLIFFLEYDLEKNRVATSANQLIDTVLPQLSKSAWDFDEKSISLLIDSLNSSPNIRQAKILSSSSLLSDDNEYANYSIYYNETFLGYLSVQYEYHSLNMDVQNQIKITAAAIFITVLLLGLSLYGFVNKFIISHITKISDYAKNYTPEKLSTFLNLNLDRKNSKDEIDQLSYSISQGKKQSLELLEKNREYNKSIEKQLNYDLLTNLPNWRNLNNYLDVQIKNYNESKGILAIYVIDLDDFSLINENMGHTLGDEALKISAIKLKSVISMVDGFVARLGGDEFAACIYVNNEKDIYFIAREIINEFGRKINYGNFGHTLGCSIGICLYPSHANETQETLINYASQAKCHAKALGKNTFFIFDEEMMENFIVENKIRSKIKEAYEKERFDLVYQPIINIDKHKVVGFETLIRWHDDELGWIHPDVFIEIAEKTGLMFDIDTWVFKKSVKQVSKWRDYYNQNFILSINFSATNFYHANFLKNAKEIWLCEEKLDWVELEITERLMLNTDDTVKKGLDLLQDQGIKINIDDFGIGYSSMAYIKHFSEYIKKIKIDRTFTTNINNTHFDTAFIKSIMLIADNLSLQVLAEGIETEEQAHKLSHLGCYLVQGNYYSQPLSPPALESFIVDWDKQITHEPTE